MPTSRNDLDLRARHVAPEILDARGGKQPVLLAPEDEDGSADVPQHLAPEGAGDVRAGVVENALHGGSGPAPREVADRKSTRLNSSHLVISYAGFCFEKKK